MREDYKTTDHETTDLRCSVRCRQCTTDAGPGASISAEDSAQFLKINLVNPHTIIAFAFFLLGILFAGLGFAASPVNGNWTIIASPNAGTGQQNQLNGVTCVSASDCWAVGDYYATTSAYQTVIQHWDGSAWTIVPSANSDPAQTNLLQKVTCVSTGDCWAVGKHKTIVGAGGVTTVIIDQTLIEHWDGASWTIVTSADSQPLANYLLDVTCTSTSDCWAVGYATDPISNLDQTLIEHWDGTLWTTITSPNATGHNELYAVSCVSAADCWAAGNSSGPSANSRQTLVEHWNGTAWTIVASPNNPAPAGSLGNSLSDVVCNSASDCWASGSSDPGPGFGWHTLIEHWDGSAWRIIDSPVTSTAQNNFLFGTACASATDCWSIGRASNGVAEQTLTEHWDGTSWTIVPSPNMSSDHLNAINAVTCVSGADCWTVGYYKNGSNLDQNLTLHYTVPPILPTSVVSRKTHGSVGDFDIDLPVTGDVGIECRSGPVSGYHRVVVTFAGAVTVTDATVTPGQEAQLRFSLFPVPTTLRF